MFYAGSAEMSKYCSECGAEISEGSKFCPNCGFASGASGEAVNQQTSAPIMGGNTKDPVTAAALNLVFPRAGYMYLGKWILGALVFLVVTCFVGSIVLEEPGVDVLLVVYLPLALIVTWHAYKSAKTGTF